MFLCEARCSLFHQLRGMPCYSLPQGHQSADTFALVPWRRLSKRPFVLPGRESLTGSNITYALAKARFEVGQLLKSCS